MGLYELNGASPSASLLDYEHLKVRVAKTLASQAASYWQYSELEAFLKQHQLKTNASDLAYLKKSVELFTSPTSFFLLTKYYPSLEREQENFIFNAFKLRGSKPFKANRSDWYWCNVEESLMLRIALTLASEDIKQDIGPSGRSMIQECTLTTPPLALLQGMQLIMKYSCDLWAGMQTVVKAICPIQSHYVNAFTLGSMPGIIFIRCSLDDPLWYAENLIHEFAHSKLIWMHTCVRLTKGESQPLYNSPWREDKRPIWGVLQGAYASWHVIELLSQIRKGSKQFEQLERKIDNEKTKSQHAIDILETSNLLTREGIEIIGAIKKHLKN